MRRLMKRVAAVVLMAACLVSLSVCTAKQEDATAKVPEISTEGILVDDVVAQSLKLSAAQTLGAPMEQMIIQKILTEAQGDQESANLYNTQIEIRHELGDAKGVGLGNASIVLLADGSYTVMIPVTFTEGSMQYVLNLNMATRGLRTEFADLGNDNDAKDVGSLMESATIYSVIGVGTVFTALVFISLLIACFKFIYQQETGKNIKKDTPALVPAVPVNTAAPAVSVDLSDDVELVAVITAAIAAYEGTSSNGLVARSIRRVQGSRWRQGTGIP